MRRAGVRQSVLGLALLAALPIASARGATIGMVADATTARATVFDGDTLAVLGSVPIPTGPGSGIGDCVLSEGLGYVTNFLNQVAVVNLVPPGVAAGVNPIGITNPGEDLALTPDGRFLLACDGSLVSPISVIDVATRSVVSTFSVGEDCNSVDVCADGTVLVTSIGSGNVRRLAIDGAGTLTDTGTTLTVFGTRNVYCAPGSAAGIVMTESVGMVSFTIPGLAHVATRALAAQNGLTAALSPTGNLVYARSGPFAPAPGFVEVFAFNPATGALGLTPIFGIPAGTIATYYGMEQMALHPDGTRLYLPDGGQVRVVDAATGALLGAITSPSIVSATGVCFQRLACGDGIPSSDEECDDGNNDAGDGCSATCRIEPGWTCSGGPSVCRRIPRHYQCYEVRPPQAFSRTGITVVDRFGSLTVALTKTSGVCAPADKNGEDPTAPADPVFLTSYQMKAPGFARVSGQQVTTQFGTLGLDVVKPARLLVPSAGGLTEPLTPLAGGLDHFSCYKVRRAAGSPRFTKVTGVEVETQLGSALVDVVKPLRLCVPADKNGESPADVDHPEQLVCYRTRSASAQATTAVVIDNQFGPQRYLVSQRRELCVPSPPSPPYGSPARAFLEPSPDLLE